MTEIHTRINSITYRGNEEILGTGLTLLDYWLWAHSDMMNNTERGIFAEFLVHTAVNDTTNTRKDWTSYDVLSPEGIRIEVKSSGYVQTWNEEKISAIKFSVKPTRSWNPETHQYSEECTRNSDVYVFCLHKHKDKESINILDLSQWTFFVLSTSTLNVMASQQKTITLSRVKSLGATETDYAHLRSTITIIARSDN